MKRRQGQKSTLILVVCGVIAGFGLGAGILHFVRDGDGTGQGASQSGAGAGSSRPTRGR
jgi:hypothetical protein